MIGSACFQETKNNQPEFKTKIMCRLAAYLGQNISLDRFLQKPVHSLIKQSWAPEEMAEARLNADGFGLCWYLPESGPVTYLNTAPIWSDTNLSGLCVSLHSPVWLGYVRSATEGQITSLANTQPLTSGNLAYVHNGFIRSFIPEVKSRFHEFLDPAIQAGIHGDTDSEYLFAVIRQILQDETNVDLSSVLHKFTEILTSIVGDHTALVNLILANGSDLYALRHAINGACPTLYYSETNPLFDQGMIIASEKLTRDNSWSAVPEHSLVKKIPNHKVTIMPL